jgi:hypothetical protein
MEAGTIWNTPVLHRGQRSLKWKFHHSPLPSFTLFYGVQRYQVSLAIFFDLSASLFHGESTEVVGTVKVTGPRDLFDRKFPKPVDTATVAALLCLRPSLKDLNLPRLYLQTLTAPQSDCGRDYWREFPLIFERILSRTPLESQLTRSKPWRLHVRFRRFEGCRRY